MARQNPLKYQKKISRQRISNIWSQTDLDNLENGLNRTRLISKDIRDFEEALYAEIQSRLGSQALTFDQIQIMGDEIKQRDEFINRNGTEDSFFLAWFFNFIRSSAENLGPSENA